MNKLIGFCQNRKLYLPELKTICGDSVMATLLMGQMEYWFSKYVDGFYKFLAPCEHPRCHSGDSWTEEMQFTEYEFRSAFDKVGKRYRSYKQLIEFTEKYQDPFDGQFYLSYYDPQSKLTVYRRNHDLLDITLEKIMNDFEPNMVDKPECDDKHNLKGVTKKSLVSKLRISQFRHLGNFSSGTQDSSVPYNKETKTTSKDDTKNTAAERKLDCQSNDAKPLPEKTQHTELAAAVNFKGNGEEDVLIGERLTTTQTRQVQKLVSCTVKRFPEHSSKLLYRAITYELLDANSFTQTGKNFKKKFNTVRKLIFEDRWDIPAGMIRETQQQRRQDIQTAQQGLREAEGDVSHWQGILEMAEKQRNHTLADNSRRPLQEAQEKKQRCKAYLATVLENSNQASRAVH